MSEGFGILEVDIFPPEVNNTSHPKAEEFRLLLIKVAEEYDCRLIFFQVQNGIAMFTFDNDALMADILKLLRK